MTREQFEARAIRKAEREVVAPHGWWGTFLDLHGPAGERVRYAGDGRWISSLNGASRKAHDSRAAAIRRLS